MKVIQAHLASLNGSRLSAVNVRGNLHIWYFRVPRQEFIIRSIYSVSVKGSGERISTSGDIYADKMEISCISLPRTGSTNSGMPDVSGRHSWQQRTRYENRPRNSGFLTVHGVTVKA
ncbi:hypothetical protein D5274_18000 [bacterium 1XD42-94]|nr:hypothetical protein [bacterium 1XD42-76]NBK06959.1 hypothetical protein [bacterium 1XD42-94]